MRRGAGSQPSNGSVRSNSTALRLQVGVKSELCSNSDPLTTATHANSKHACLLSIGSTVGMSTVTLPVAAQPSAEKDLGKAKITRHASFNSAPTPVSVQRQVNSAPCSPRCKLTSSPNILSGQQLVILLDCGLIIFSPRDAALLNQPVDYSMRTSHGTVCALPFGNGTE